MKLHLFTLLFLLSFVSVGLHAQNGVDSDLNLMQEAYINVQKGNYAEALPYYQKMLEMYPKDPTYNYFVGRCILFAKQDFEESIQYLKFASVRNVPFDVYFYLGLAYLFTYQFEDAIANFKWFEKSGSKKELRQLEVSNYTSMAQNGLYLIKYYQEPQVYKKENAYKGDFYASYKIKDLEGRFFDRYRYLNHKRDSLSEQSIIFVPNFMEENEVLYFSAKNKKRSDYDIFRITRLPDNSWSDPENLGDVINTPFDESYPFIHADGTTLYFASKGHYSMGGYDLYRSSWNWETQEWTKPENLDFPINSPFDDILFVPSPDKKFAFFASDREMQELKYNVYKIKLDNQNPYLEYMSNNQIKDIALLNVNVILEEKKPEKELAEVKPEKSNSIVKVKKDENFIQKSEYDSLLNSAVSLQLKADSVRWLIDDKRVFFDQTSDVQERNEIGNEIIELEQNLYSLQKEADACYEKVREIEQLNLASNKLTYESEQTEQQEKALVEEVKADSEIVKIVEEPKDNDFEKSELQPIISEYESKDQFEYGLRVVVPSSYNPENPIKINEQLPDGIVYMIQLGAFSSEKNPSVFKGLEPLTCIKKSNSNIHKYYAGLFLQLSNAEKKLQIVKSKGFRDSYIVAFQNGKIIPINSAVKKESKKVPERVVAKVKEEKQIVKEDLGVIYVIQGELRLKENQKIEEIRQLLNENLDLFVKKNENSIKFIVNSFNTFEDAFKIKSEIEAITQKDVEVHAYFAENQIPIDQARKITK